MAFKITMLKKTTSARCVTKQFLNLIKYTNSFHIYNDYAQSLLLHILPIIYKIYCNLFKGYMR